VISEPQGTHSPQYREPDFYTETCPGNEPEATPCQADELNTTLVLHVMLSGNNNELSDCMGRS